VSSRRLTRRDTTALDSQSGRSFSGDGRTRLSFNIGRQRTGSRLGSVQVPIDLNELAALFTKIEGVSRLDPCVIQS
jgi:hypothetical protein